MNAQLCTKKLKVLYEFSRLLGQALNLQRTLGKVLSVLSDSLEMKRATITLRRENSDVLAIVASHGLTRQEMERGIYRIDEGVTGHIFRTAKPYVIPDISREPLFLNRTGARRIERGRIAFLGVPILLQGGPIGVLNVDRLFGDEVSFEEDIEFLTVVSALIAQIVRLNEEVAERERGLLLANRSLKAEISEKYDHFFMVGSSPAMRRVQDIIGKVAKSPASVLLLGESGTGKTLVARIIHEMSRRADRPFIKVNCAALPENLLEAELFGFERGAFTGAERSKPGRIEEANGGSLFLDEIGELPLPLQSKLLRFLQEREFERLGSNRTLRVDVRIIAATNRDLERAAGEGQFREDLYYRLNVVPIQVPALRDRSADIPLLLDHFVRKFEREYQKILRLSDETQAGPLRILLAGQRAGAREHDRADRHPLRERQDRRRGPPDPHPGPGGEAAFPRPARPARGLRRPRRAAHPQGDRAQRDRLGSGA